MSTLIQESKSRLAPLVTKAFKLILNSANFSSPAYSIRGVYG